MKPVTILRVASLHAAVGAAAALVAHVAARPARTVELHMAGYAFNDSNPVIRVRPGERIRFVLTNDETSNVLHNFGIAALGVDCGAPMTPGERREVTVTMPDSGSFAYTCCTHPGMGGTIAVTAR
jgi:plastocyanin